MQSNEFICSTRVHRNGRNERQIAERCTGHTLQDALLTGGWDKPYAVGMALALSSQGMRVDLIGSDELSSPELVNNPRISFLSFLGLLGPETSLAAKIL